MTAQIQPLNLLPLSWGKTICIGIMVFYLYLCLRQPNKLSKYFVVIKKNIIF